MVSIKFVLSVAGSTMFLFALLMWSHVLMAPKKMLATPSTPHAKAKKKPSPKKRKAKKAR